jgi:hypothetical protein
MNVIKEIIQLHQKTVILATKPIIQQAQIQIIFQLVYQQPALLVIQHFPAGNLLLSAIPLSHLHQDIQLRPVTNATKEITQLHLKIAIPVTRLIIHLLQIQIIQLQVYQQPVLPVIPPHQAGNRLLSHILHSLLPLGIQHQHVMIVIKAIISLHLLYVFHVTQLILTIQPIQIIRLWLFQQHVQRVIPQFPDGHQPHILSMMPRCFRYIQVSIRVNGLNVLNVIQILLITRFLIAEDVTLRCIRTVIILMRNVIAVIPVALRVNFNL